MCTFLVDDDDDPHQNELSSSPATKVYLISSPNYLYLWHWATKRPRPLRLILHRVNVT